MSCTLNGVNWKRVRIQVVPDERDSVILQHKQPICSIPLSLACVCEERCWQAASLSHHSHCVLPVSADTHENTQVFTCIDFKCLCLPRCCVCGRYWLCQSSCRRTQIHTVSSYCRSVELRLSSSVFLSRWRSGSGFKAGVRFIKQNCMYVCVLCVKTKLTLYHLLNMTNWWLSNICIPTPRVCVLEMEIISCLV